MGERQKLEVPMSGRPGWGEEVCSAGVGCGGAGVCAASEYSGQGVLRPGLRLELHVDLQMDPGNPWGRAAGAAHF